MLSAQLLFFFLISSIFIFGSYSTAQQPYWSWIMFLFSSAKRSSYKMNKIINVLLDLHYSSVFSHIYWVHQRSELHFCSVKGLRRSSQTLKIPNCVLSLLFYIIFVTFSLISIFVHSYYVWTSKNFSLCNEELWFIVWQFNLDTLNCRLAHFFLFHSLAGGL